MARTRPEKKPQDDRQSTSNGKKVLNGRVQKDQKTDYSRWRLLDEAGRQTWHYLRTDEEVKKWPQSIADKFHLGLPTVRDAVRSLVLY
jgi:lanosterol synthase